MYSNTRFTKDHKSAKAVFPAIFAPLAAFCLKSRFDRRDPQLNNIAARFVRYRHFPPVSAFGGLAYSCDEPFPSVTILLHKIIFPLRSKAWLNFPHEQPTETSA
jgi:hypothetical protein